MSQAASNSGFGPKRPSRPAKPGDSTTPPPPVPPTRGDPTGTPPEDHDDQAELAIADGGEIPAWLDAAIPWISSILIHLGIFLVLLFAIKAISTVIHKKAHPIIIPQAWNSRFSLHPGGHPHPGHNNNPLHSARQDIKRALSHSANTTTSINKLLSDSSQHSLAFIAVGPHGGTASGGALASFGIPGGGMGSGPPSQFMGHGGNATRIVYIIDHAGGMLDNFGFLERKLDSSIDRLVPLQSFSVIIFRKRFHVLGPSARTGKLEPATGKIKQEVRAAIKRVQPQGPNAYRLNYFLKPFQAAFRMHPQIIYFLTNGSFDPKLITEIQKLNKGKKVIIFTYAFFNHDPIFNEQLKKIAAENRGEYKLVTR